MHMQWDVIVVGAGPAGMSAAMQCAQQGLQVLVLDRQKEAGGQIWKNAGSAGAKKVRFLGSEYAQGAKIVQTFMQAKVTFMSGAHVWHVAGKSLCVSIEGKSYYLTAKAILLATGAMERPAPIQGWELPEVMGAGACDILLKSAGITPASPVVICGNGPLILQTLAHLCHLNVPVSGLILTGKFQKNAWSAFLNAHKILGRPLYFMHGMGFSLQAVLKKIPTYLNAQDINVQNSGEENGIVVDFTAQGKARKLHAQTLLVHEGIISETRITQLAKCRHVWNTKNLYWHADVDMWGHSNVSGLFVAGDIAGVRGAEAALATGNLAGLGICADLGKITQSERDAKAKTYERTLMRCQWMQDFTDALFTPNPARLLPHDESIVCRCEEIKAKELKDIILSGCYSPDAVKSQSRSGMGMCQGRMCASSVANLIANVHGIPLEKLNPYTARPPLFPMEIGELAEMSMPNIGL